jgi:hypothetical protein
MCASYIHNKSGLFFPCASDTSIKRYPSERGGMGKNKGGFTGAQAPGKSFKRLYHSKQCYYYTTVATPNGVVNSSTEDAGSENSTQISASTLNP